MKKLPIGISSIEKIINRDYLYVDKTDMIYRLITEGEYYFLSRPRRFGKSLLLSTLEAIFKGDKELFKNCHIYNAYYDWVEHPVIYFDFANISAETPEELASELQRVLEDTAASYNKSIACPNLRRGFVDLVRALSELGPVVILIDEYDSPLLDNSERSDIAAGNQHVLKNFYATLEGLDKQLRFVFATGVSKFSQVSLFSGFNNLNDITIHPDYATLLGYTAADLQNFLGEQIRQVTDKRRAMSTAAATEFAVLAEMKEWYNGYRFAWGTEPVYNPHSVMSFLDTGRVQNYWFRTGTPTLLIQQIQKRPSSVLEFGKLVAEESALLDSNGLAQVDLIPLMWQTGYLTIRGYDEASRDYTLDFPNREVREAFFKTLANKFTGLKPSVVRGVAPKCRRHLEQREFAPFIGVMRTLFAKIPNILLKHESEASYHVAFLMILEAMEMKVHAELPTNIGRIDLVVEMQNCIYIMELKFNKASKAALKQIETKNYKQRYTTEEKDLILMGINFSSKGRNISDCKAVTYFKEGSKSPEIDIPAQP